MERSACKLMQLLYAESCAILAEKEAILVDLMTLLSMTVMCDPRRLSSRFDAAPVCKHRHRCRRTVLISVIICPFVGVCLEQGDRMPWEMELIWSLLEVVVSDEIVQDRQAYASQGSREIYHGSLHGAEIGDSCFTFIEDKCRTLIDFERASPVEDLIAPRQPRIEAVDHESTEFIAAAAELDTGDEAIVEFSVHSLAIHYKR